jgi:hypothetical protein
VGLCLTSGCKGEPETKTIQRNPETLPLLELEAGALLGFLDPEAGVWNHGNSKIKKHCIFMVCTRASNIGGFHQYQYSIFSIFGFNIFNIFNI